MTPRQAFKLGFWTECAARGLSPDETTALAAAALKQAQHEVQAGIIGSTIGGLMNFGGKVTSKALELAPTALTWGALVPPLAGIGIGAGAGYGLARAQESADPVDVETAQRQELVEAYRNATAQLEQARLQHRLRQEQEQTARPRLHRP